MSATIRLEVVTDDPEAGATWAVATFPDFERALAEAEDIIAMLEDCELSPERLDS